MAIKENGSGSGFDLAGLFNKAKQFVMTFQYKRQLLIGVVVAKILVMIFLGYRWHQHKNNQKALAAFVDCMDKYEQMLKKGDAELSTVYELANKNYELHKGTVIAPQFLLMQANIALKENKYEAALCLMKQVVALTQGSPLHDLHRIKYGLLLLDSQLQDAQLAGQEILQNVAENKHSVYQDFALYQLGRSYFVKDNFDMAKKFWLELVDLQQTMHGTPSTWTMLAQQKLDTLL
jgi:predicted negative regulator of RcsB-dependent stress response